jgi:hypothetical protein
MAETPSPSAPDIAAQCPYLFQAAVRGLTSPTVDFGYIFGRYPAKVLPDAS